MNPRERFQGMLRRESVDRPAWAFWRHYPHDDFTQQFVQVHLQDLLHCDYDLWKIALPSAYPVMDYGIRYGFEGDPYGRPVFYNSRIEKAEDWSALEPLEIQHSAVLKQMLLVVEAMVKAAPADRPVQVTLFSPFTQAVRICGGVGRMMESLTSDPYRVWSALEALAETTRRFAAELVKLGIDGFFYVVQECSLVGLKRYEESLRRLDGSILEIGNLWLNTLHLHGEWDIEGQYCDYPVSMLHWDVQASGISLLRGAKHFPGIVGGGLNWPLTGWRSQDVCKGAVRELASAMQHLPYMLSAGCVLPYEVPSSVIREVFGCLKDSDCWKL